MRSLTPRTLSHEEACRFYDRFGAKQDWQGFYEDAATDDLSRHADLATATRVIEFGCGTGRFAEAILEHHLPVDARYVGVDVSSRMVDLARTRLARFHERAEVRQSDGAPAIAAEGGSADRLVSNYVLDLLSNDDIAALLRDAHRVLREGGLLGLVSLTHGWTFVSRAVEWSWSRLYAVRPLLVGGCRPLELRQFVQPPRWHVRYHHRVARFGVPSEILVAEKRRSVAGS
jgi:ubiquinone/menaquinone biosynthesis C-methylase UbiE